MKMRNGIITLSLFVVLSSGHAETDSKGTPYVDGTKSFLKIKNANRQAEAWAMCVASYKVMAVILSQSAPARSQQLKELSNGAKVAILMSQVTDGLSTDMAPGKFNSLWKMAQLSSIELPKTRITMLAAELESANKKGKEAFLNNLSATVAVCAKNLPAQQMYIDTWRELAKSGLLKLPDN